MSGSNQAVNLSGMLSQMANTFGELGDTGMYTADAIRNFARPELDREDPASMNAYGQYLIKNGQEAAGQQMLQASALRAKELRVLDGEKQIAQITAGWADMLPSQRKAAEKTIAGIGEKYGISPMKTAQYLETVRQAERQLDDGDLRTANQDKQFSMGDATTRYGIDVNNATAQRGQDFVLQAALSGQAVQEAIAEGNQSTQLAIQASQAKTAADGQNIQWRIAQGQQDIQWAGLAEQEQQRLSTQAIANSKIEYDYDALEEGARQFDENLSFQNIRLEQEQWMNSATVDQWAEENKISWGDLDLRGKQVAITELLANNTIDETKFSQIMRSNQDRRADDLLPHEIGLLQAQVDVLKEDARFKNINWQKVEYELGLAEKLESTVINRAKLDNRLLKAQINRTDEEADLLQAQTETERERPDYIEAQVEAMEALSDLQKEQFQWNQRVDQTAMDLADLNAISARAVDQAQVLNLTGLTNSRLFSDQLTMAGLLGDKVSQAESDAYSYAYDPTKPSSVAGARKAFLAAHPGEGKVFDEVATARATTQKLLLETSAFSQGLRENVPISASELRDARMPEDLIRQISVLKPAERNAQINQWVNREIRGEVTGVPTTDLITIYTGVADDMVSEAFGWHVPLGADFDGVNEANLIKEVAAAMASAAAAGYSDGQRYAAGLSVMRNAVRKSGSNDAISALGRLNLKYGD